MNGTTTAAADQLLSPEEVSEILGGVPPATLKRWRTQRTGPVVLHIGRQVRYRRSAVEAWLNLDPPMSLGRGVMRALGCDRGGGVWLIV